MIIAIIGLTSLFSLHTLSNSINILMVDNYKSIKSVDYMLYYAEKQNSIILNYVFEDEESSIKSLNKNREEFNHWYKIEESNVTEKGEKVAVIELQKAYDHYVDNFEQLRKIKKSVSKEEAYNFYTKNILKDYINLGDSLKAISKLNEQAMFTHRDDVVSETNQSFYLVLIMSLAALIIAFVVSRISLNIFMRPIDSLMLAMKSVKEGDFQIAAPVISNDEIGHLTIEFNNMTKRLEEYESSTKGKLLSEKNKSIAIVKSISDPIIVLDRGNKIKLINTSFENLFNIKECNILNKPFKDVINNNYLYDEIHKSTNDVNKENHCSIVNILSNGKNLFFNISVNHVRNGTSITGVVVVLENVTSIKKVEKLKSDFISTISHEFKTPLTSIMMGTSLITNQDIGDLNEKQIRIINAIKEDTEKLSELVTDMLHMSKLESDKAGYSFGACSVIGILHNCIKNFYDKADLEEINLYYEADENLPKVYADSEKITWVLNNLISNAFKYTNAGDTILINTSVKFGKMCIYVKDTGVGIQKEYHKRIFDKFQQVEGFDSEMRGTGLGLSIAKEIIESHDGEIWCESKIDEGSTFYFTLQLCE